MTTAQATETSTDFQAIRGNCPGTGRSASVCSDQTHATCGVGHAASVCLDRKVQADLRRADGSY